MGGKNSAMNAKFKAKEWQWQLKTEVKHLDKEIKKIQAGEAKLQKEIHTQAAKGDVESVQFLAKSVVKSRAAVKRLEKTKVSMHAVDLQLTTALATMNTSSALRLSADVMKKMNEIARIPEIGPTMEAMRKEMASCAEADVKMEEALKIDGEEEDAQAEVQKVLEEMALDQMGPLSRAAASSSTESAPAAAVVAPPAFVPPARQAVAVGAEPVPVGAPQAAAPAPPPPQPPAAPAAQAPAASSSTPPENQASAAVSSAPPPMPPAAAEQPPPAPPPAAEAAPPPAAAAAASASSDDGGNPLDDDLMRRLANLKDS